MKHFFSFLILLGFVTYSFSQTTINDSISLGSNSTRMSYYSFANGEAANVATDNWDIQIITTIMTASIRTNNADGVQLYALQNPDTSNWLNPDTTGMIPLYNSDTTWDVGAFNEQGNNYDDYGWGTYDFVSHNVVGTKIFAIKLIDGTFRKIWIKNLIAGDLFHIELANLDNSGDTTITLKKTNYSSKTAFFYSLVNLSALDLEPPSNSWDVVFKRYVTNVSPVPPAFYYPVNGVLSNKGVKVAEARGVEVNITDNPGVSYNSDISTIGYDWKTQSLMIVDSLVYFVDAQDGKIYKLVFTGYSGLTTGHISFSKTEVTQASGISENSLIKALTAYPNPAADRLNVLYTLKEQESVNITVADLAGKTWISRDKEAGSGLNKLMLQTDQLPGGYYFITVGNSREQLTFKFVKTE